MEFYDVIKKRKSIRRYRQDTVPDRIIYKLLEAARWAPSWHNRQCREFIVAKNPNVVKKLTKGKLKTITDAPVYIVACGDPAKSGKKDAQEYYLVDVAIAMQHIILAATAEGLGSSWLAGVFDEDYVREVLNIPKHIRVVAVTPLGYPAETLGIRPLETVVQTTLNSATRRKVEEFCHFNQYGNSFKIKLET